MKNSLIKIFVLVLLMVAKSAGFYAQSSQACNNNSQNICTNPTFTFNSSGGTGLTGGLNISNPSVNPQVGNGSNPSAPPNTGCLLSNGPGPQWLILTVNSTGNLGFSFGAAGSQFPQAGFYDWAMWAYTPNTCGNIFNNSQAPVACVWNCASNGGTGMGPPPAAVPGNTPSPCNFAPSIPVVAGQQFLILLSNFSGVTTSVSIANNGTAGLACNPFSVSNATACPNELAVVTATWIGVTNVTYTLYPGATTQTSPSFTVSAPATQVYTVVAQGLDTASSTINTRSTTFALNIIPAPQVTLFVPSNVCQYAIANITASGPGVTSYSWAGPAGFTSTTQVSSIFNIQPSQSGSYSVTAVYGPNTHTCSLVASAPLNVLPVNDVAVTPSVVSICKPANASFQANATSAASYSWSGPNSYTSAVAHTTIYYPDVNASGIYTVTATFVTGTLTCYNTNTVSLTVNPILTFSIEPFERLCSGDNLNVTGPLGATTYTWFGGNGFSSNTKDLVIPSIQPSQSGVYTLSVSLGPCNTSSSVQVQVLTPVVYTLSPDDRTICLGDTVTLIAGLSGGSENFAYKWIPSTYLSAPTGSVVTGELLGTTVYNVVGYDIACPTYTVSHPFTVNVKQPPIPKFQLSKTEGCEPLCMTYNPNTTDEAAFTTFDFGGTRQVQSTDSLVHYCLDEPGNYTLNVQSKGKNGCIGTYKYPVVLIVNPKPHTDISWNPMIPTTTDNQVTFYPSAKYGPIISYNWTFTGTEITGDDTTDVKNPQRIYESVGKYPLMLISKTDKCSDTIIKILDIRDEFSVYIPNSFTPNGDGNNDFFMIKGLGMRTEGFSMDLYDRWGNPVFSTREILKGWDGTVKGQPAPDGVYVYKIKVVGANGEGRKEYVGHVTLLK